MASSWVITGQRQTTVNNGQTFVDAMIISFQTGAGNFGRIVVTADNYTEESVTDLVQTAADNMDAIGALSAGTVTESPLLEP